MIAAIKSELTERGWLKDEDFVDIITLAQTAPGLFAANIAILTGHKLRGTKGSIVATIASCLPPFLIIPFGVYMPLYYIPFSSNKQDLKNIPLNLYIILKFPVLRPLFSRMMYDSDRLTIHYS